MKKINLCIFPSDPIIEYYKKGEIKQRYFNPNNIFDHVDIISFTDNEVDEIKVKELVGTGTIKIHTVGKISNKNKKKNLEKILKIVEEINPDVIRGFNSLLPGWYAATCSKKLKIPFYLSLHTQYDHMRKIARKESLKKFLALKYTEKFIEPYVLQNADRITIVYKIIESYVKKHTNTNAEILYNKIELERFSSGKKIDSLPQPLIISVGRLIEPKNHQCLINAMKNVNANLLIIGDGVLYENLNNLIHKLGLREKVAIKKSIPNNEIQDFYKSSKIFALAYDTKLEGIPIPVMEAMASKLPIIIPFSEHNTIGELGKSVIYVENTPESFSKNINILLKDQEKQMELAKKSFEKSKEFDSKILENREAEIYLELISGKK
jgi:glycosyltransferase involved in cell wall biosynthesis